MGLSLPGISNGPRRTLGLFLAPLAAVLLSAEDPAWKDRAISQWDAQDAKQVLADSPWVKHVTPQHVRDLYPNQCLAAGDWTGCTGKGIGLDGTGLFGEKREDEAIARAHYHPPVAPVVVRWESALPVRAAEQKAGDVEIPSLDSGHYAIAIYHIATPQRWNLDRELKGVSFLRRYKRKDLKPSHVEILRRLDGTATILYLFPSSVEIGKRDGRVEFVAQIGRLFVSQFFDMNEMQHRGELELLLPSNASR
jgi:hypothetical protein